MAILPEKDRALGRQLENDGDDPEINDLKELEEGLSTSIQINELGTNS